MTEVQANTRAHAAPQDPPRPLRTRRRQLSLVEDCPRPIVKWAGGKGALLGKLIALLPADLSSGCYFEPFAGGAALFFGALPVRAVVSDVNDSLVEMYREVARDPVGLRAELVALFDRHAEDASGTYYEARGRWNDARRAWSPQRRAACFIYLNRTCFNGLWRENRSGQMNVPVGRTSSGGPPPCPSMAHLSAVSVALRGAEVLCADYAEVIQRAGRGDFVYLDPPYLARSKTASFSSYTVRGFGPADHDQLGAYAVDLVARGARVLVSSADVPGARERYPGFEAIPVSVQRSVGAGAKSRVRVGELILVGGYDLPSGALVAISASSPGAAS